MWKIQHPNGRREINELHVPLGQPVKLTLASQDVIHSFYIPAFRVKQDVLPGRYVTMWFQPTRAGEYHLFCAEYCGTYHSGMIGRVVVMHHGLIEQVGTPAQLYHSPATRFVAGFIGSPAMNLLPCALEEAAGGLRLRLSDTIAFALPAERDARYRPHAGKPGLILGLRPEHITDPRPPLRPAQRSFEVPVDVCEPLGMETLLHFTLQGIDVCARVDPAAGAPAGSRATLVADLNHMHLIDGASKRVL